MERLQRQQSLVGRPERKALVSFCVYCETAYGETVYLVGNVEDLKAWDLARAVPLSSHRYSVQTPVWTTTSDYVLPPNVPIEYKFVKRSVDGRWDWESLPQGINRSLVLQEGEVLELHHQFGVHKVTIKHPLEETCSLRISDDVEDSKQSPTARPITVTVPPIRSELGPVQVSLGLQT